MEPFVVHKPRSWSKLKKLLARGADKVGFVAKYQAKCGKKVELPPNVVVREADGEWKHYFVAGPHDRYYEKCEACYH